MKYCEILQDVMLGVCKNNSQLPPHISSASVNLTVLDIFVFAKVKLRQLSSIDLTLNVHL